MSQPLGLAQAEDGPARMKDFHHRRQPSPITEQENDGFGDRTFMSTASLRWEPCCAIKGWLQ